MESSSSGDEIAPNFASEAFVGTARYYSQFRPPYPRRLFDDLLVRAEGAPGGRLLDLGCGPGRIAIPLQSAFRAVWAVDPEPEMLDEGRRLAGESSCIRWVESTAERLSAPRSGFDLVIAADSFHRFDQRVVGAKVIEWLRPNRYFALSWHVGFWPGNQDWQKAARRIIEQYAGTRLGAKHPKNVGQFDSFQEALVAIGFRAVSLHEFEAVHEWTVDSMLGFLYSTSILSERVLGDRRSAFETHFRQSLARIGSSEPFRERVRFGYVMGRRPS